MTTGPLSLRTLSSSGRNADKFQKSTKPILAGWFAAAKI